MLIDGFAELRVFTELRHRFLSNAYVMRTSHRTPGNSRFASETILHPWSAQYEAGITEVESTLGINTIHFGFSQVTYQRDSGNLSVIDAAKILLTVPEVASRPAMNVAALPLSDSRAVAVDDVQSLLARLMDVARASALEEMASGLAHELNQPLGAIATYSQAAERMLAKSPPMIEAAMDAVRQVSKEALGAGDGIRRIRRLFSREALRKTRCSLGAILCELAPLLEILGKRHDARLEIAIDSEVPDALADPLRVQHVLFTLVVNAFQVERRQLQDAKVKVTVTGDRYSVEVAVIDNGIGIAADAHDQIFRPFYSTKANGTGLGLASVRNIVEMHEGTIGFDSTVEGSRFWFRLPAFVES